MTMSPGTPFAGSDVQFNVKGLEPWDIVEVTFLEPSGAEAAWIGDDQVARRWSTKYFLADENGVTRWTRYGAQDQVGDWQARIEIDDSLRLINYSYTKFRLPRLVSENLGVPLYGCRSDEATIFFSDSVNFSVTVDMHANLEATADFLERQLGLRTAEVPVIYLLGSQSDFQAAAGASGKQVGWEAGFFRSFGEHAGIFIQSDKQRTELYQTLTHEYIHFLLDEVSGGADLPAWLNEGLAGFYEYEVGMRGENPTASYLRMLRSADRARNAATEGKLFSLSRIESQREWNSRTHAQATLQYAQSHMLVRYLNERYGVSVPIQIMALFVEGHTIADAVEAVTGLSYSGFEESFARWLLSWDDPARAEARHYLEVMVELDDEQFSIRGVRNEAIREWNRSFNRVKAEEVATHLNESTKGLVQRAGSLQPSPAVAGLHEAATAYFGVLDEWLTNELAFMSTALTSRIETANALIPEMRYRRFDFENRLNEVLFTMNLHD